MVQLHETEPLRETLLHYVNRLSDYFFVVARVANQQAGGKEVHWQKPK
jgi:cob(I)alamin adenosyltransferase